MTQPSPPFIGAEALLKQLENQGADYVFASPIAVMAPVWEAIARRQSDSRLRYLRCRHEMLAVSVAAGYYKATGRSQIVFLPTSLGVQHGCMALAAALQERTPMTVLSLDTLSHGDDPMLDPGPEWPSLLVDFAGPARNSEAVVKWSGCARTPSELVNEVRRACFFAQSGPPGPTLVEIGFELLMNTSAVAIPGWAPPVPVAAPGSHVDGIAERLVAADNPVIVTEYGGRTEQQRQSLVRIAEALAAPVFETFMPAYHNFPRSHPLYGAGPVEAVLADADAVLVAGCNGGWHPPHATLPEGCAIIHMDEDPLRPRASYWSYPATETIPGDLALNLDELATCVQRRAKPRPDAHARWQGHAQRVRSEARKEIDQADSVAAGRTTAVALFDALHDALPDDSICVDEIIAQVPHMIRHLYRRKPIMQIRGSAGRLGTGLGTALGVKLARPQQLVVCILGDGAWHYNPVPAALGFAQEYGLPLLIVVCNNEQYASQTWNLQKYYPDGAAVREKCFTGDVIAPTPDYVKQAEGYGGTGERVHDVAELAPAIRRACDTVAAGQTYLLDVIVDP